MYTVIIEMSKNGLFKESNLLDSIITYNNKASIRFETPPSRETLMEPTPTTCLEDYKTMSHVSLYKQHLYK